MDLPTIAIVLAALMVGFALTYGAYQFLSIDTES
jgi:hypothetical protein